MRNSAWVWLQKSILLSKLENATKLVHEACTFFYDLNGIRFADYNLLYLDLYSGLHSELSVELTQGRFC